MRFLQYLARFVFVIVISLLFFACQGDSSLQADAGEDFSVNVGESPTFDGCGSTGDIVNYLWKITEAPEEMATDAGKIIREVDSNCSFTLDAGMGVDEMGRWKIELEVSDESGNTSTDEVIVEVIE